MDVRTPQQRRDYLEQYVRAHGNPRGNDVLLQLAHTLGVSRTTIRDDLKILKGAGIRGAPPPPPAKAEPAPEFPATPLGSRQALLHDVRAHRQTESGVAFTTAAALELKILAEVEALEAAEKAQRDRAEDEAGRLARFREELRGLPMRMRQAIRAIVLEETG